jgi:hypothetical protein
MQQRYRVLRVVATILKVIAVIVLLFGILGACGILALGVIPRLAGVGGNSSDAFGIGVGGIGGVMVGVGLLFASLLYFLLFYAFGELLSLLIALEENTRITAERLMARPASETALTPAPPPMPPRAGG